MGKKREIKVIGRARKATSKKWGDSYNVQNLNNGQTSWVNMREYRNSRLIPEEEVLLGEFDDGRIMESKIEEINNWERNGVFEDVKNRG